VTKPATMTVASKQWNLELKYLFNTISRLHP
jgi:hypothetical protein